MFISALFTIAKERKQPKYPSTDDKVKVLCVCVCVCPYTHNRILLGHKKECSLAICDNMDGLRGYYASEKKSDREDKCCVFTSIWNLENKPKCNKTKIDSQICRTSLWLPEGRIWGMHKIGKEKRLQTTSYKIIGSQGYNCRARHNTGLVPGLLPAGSFLTHPLLSSGFCWFCQLMSYWVQPIEGKWREKLE